uniref:Uncharacterized protein n=1 Tax=Alexandrium monilatum TaxID=311494 RepID=A0A6T1IIG6_9DINO
MCPPPGPRAWLPKGTLSPSAVMAFPSARRRRRGQLLARGGRPATATGLLVALALAGRCLCWASPPGPSRRSAAAAGAAAAAAALAGIAPAAHADQFILPYMKPGNPDKLDYRDPDFPPVPDEDPFVRKLQAKSWAMEPIIRTRLFLMEEKRRVQPNPFADYKFFVKRVDSSTQWDVLDEASWKSASELGKVLLDNDLSFRREEWESFVYATDKDQEWVARNLNVTDIVEMPPELVEKIRLIGTRKFAG